MKSGIDYFSFDVDFFEDPKIQYLSARFGIKGEIFIIKLLCSIYRNGYYIDWDEDSAVLFAKRVGGDMTHALVKDVLYELFKRSFFDERIFKSFGILTSRGIQKRYLRSVSRRKDVEFVKEYALVDLKKFTNLQVLALCTQNEDKCIHNVYNTSKNVYISDENAYESQQSKVKESKVKESKVKESKVIKDIGEKENSKPIFDNPLLETALNDFKVHRKALKKPMTDKAIELFVNRLNNGFNSDDEKIEAIQIAIERGWLSVERSWIDNLKQKQGVSYGQASYSDGCDEISSILDFED